MSSSGRVITFEKNHTNLLLHLLYPELNMQGDSSILSALLSAEGLDRLQPLVGASSLHEWLEHLHHDSRLHLMEAVEAGRGCPPWRPPFLCKLPLGLR